MIWETGGKRHLSTKPGGTPTSPIMLLTWTQAIPTPTAPMIFRWSRMNSSSLLMQPPWKKSKAPFVVSVAVGARLRPHCKQVLMYFKCKSRARYTRTPTQLLHQGRCGHERSEASHARCFHRSHLHLVDVGRVVPEAAELGGGLTAAVRYQSATCSGANKDALGPVGRAVAAATLELRRDEC